MCVVGASNLRAIPPPLSPQGQARVLNLQQPGLPAPGFEPNMVSIFNLVSDQLTNNDHALPNKITNHLMNSFWTQHSDLSGYGILRNQSPPPAHQQASPITPVNYLLISIRERCFCFYAQFIFESIN